MVHLCLPHYLHVPVSEYFASHGVNVFCEKPVGLNTAQAKEFVEFEAAHPEVKIGICLQNRLNRTTVELSKSCCSVFCCQKIEAKNEHFAQFFSFFHPTRLV